MSKKALLSLLLVGLLAFGAGLGTYAWFTSSVTSGENIFETGTLTVDLGAEGKIFDLGDIENMQPGDTTNEVVIDIINNGSLDLAWFGKFILTGDKALKESIYIDKMKMEFLDPDGNEWEPADEFIINGRSLQGHYEKMVDRDLDVITLNNFLKDNAMGAGNGVQMGALKPNYKYRLTVKFGLPELAGNNCQGKTANIKFVVNATQIKAGALDKLFNDIKYLSSPGSNHEEWLNEQIAKQEQ